jgi:phospholipid/cholesterol/gamma-HCH transport system substrate-binding protein
MTRSRLKMPIAAVLAVLAFAGATVAIHKAQRLNQIHLVAYFSNTNGIFSGDEVRILGVKVGNVDSIEVQPLRAKVSFAYDAKYKVPAQANAVILSPSLVTARAIQLTPAYTGGPVMQSNTTIPEDRTAVPVEWDDFRGQLQRLTQTLQPTEPGGVAPLGELINTAADNLRGQGPTIHDAIVKMAQAVSALSDHSSDIFGTVRNLATLVSALNASSGLMSSLNTKLASVTSRLANDPDEVARAVRDLNTAVDQVGVFVKDNREALGTTADKTASIFNAVVASLGDIKQLLHTTPSALGNVAAAWQPAHGGLAGLLETANMSNPIQFICGAIEAASRLNAEQSAKLCVQYLAPIVKNRVYSNLPLGLNLVVGPQARPNEITYSEDWLRPDYVRPPAAAPAEAQPASPGPPPQAAPAEPGPLPAAAIATNPAAGLQGIMVPQGPAS